MNFRITKSQGVSPCAEAPEKSFLRMLFSKDDWPNRDPVRRFMKLWRTITICVETESADEEKDDDTENLLEFLVGS